MVEYDKRSNMATTFGIFLVRHLDPRPEYPELMHPCSQGCVVYDVLRLKRR